MDRKALILAGGRSSRMGTDKALLRFRGKRMVDHMVELAGSVVGGADQVLISGWYDPHVCVADEFPGRGPLEGLRCALKTLPAGALCLVVPVDMPLLSAATVEVFFQNMNEADQAVCFSESELPCLMRVSEGLRQSIEDLLSDFVPASRRSFRELFKKIHTRKMPAPVGADLRNLNTLDDWMEVRDEFET